MTNRYVYSFLAALCALVAAAPAQAQYGTGAILQVPRATSAITLDGTANEGAWSTAATMDLTANWNSGYYEGYGDPDVPDVAVTGKLLWNDGQLFLFIRFEDYQALFFDPDGVPYNGEQLLVGVDLTHEGDDQIDDSYSGWPDNAPDLGPTTYKISGAAGAGDSLITSNWFFSGISPVDSNWVAGSVYVDNPNFEWGVEMAINASQITENGLIGFNAGGGTGDATLYADTTYGGDAVYGYFSWGASAPPSSAGGDVMNNSASFGTLQFVNTVANEGGAASSGFALRNASPNPFRGSTTLTYEMDRSGDVSLTVYDVLGREVSTLSPGAQSAGAHTATLDASALPAGVYMVRMAVDGATVASRQISRVR